METAILTIRVPQEVKDQLGKLVDVTHRSQSFLGGEAIQRYIDFVVLANCGNSASHH